MDELHRLRQKYGRNCYLSVFDDGLTVPWRPLSIQEYLGYATDLERQIYLPTQLENEIFKKCVLDDTCLRQLDYLHAGVISTVVQNIIEYSGPSLTNPIDQVFAASRAKLNSHNVIHELVELITMAYPYKPEDVYMMDYETLIMRAAQAESKLIKAGVLEAPISFQSTETQQQKPTQPRQQIDAKKLWEEQQKQQIQERQQKIAANQSAVKPTNKPANVVDREKWWKKSPVLETNKHLNTRARKIEEAEIDAFASTGWDKVDKAILQADMVEQAKTIYADVIAELEAKKRAE